MYKNLMPFPVPDSVALTPPTDPGGLCPRSCALQDLDPALLSDLCDDFRRSVFAKGGQVDPTFAAHASAVALIREDVVGLRRKLAINEKRYEASMQESLDVRIRMLQEQEQRLRSPDAERAANEHRAHTLAFTKVVSERDQLREVLAQNEKRYEASLGKEVDVRIRMLQEQEQRLHVVDAGLTDARRERDAAVARVGAVHRELVISVSERDQLRETLAHHDTDIKELRQQRDSQIVAYDKVIDEHNSVIKDRDHLHDTIAARDTAISDAVAHIARLAEATTKLTADLAIAVSQRDQFKANLAHHYTNIRDLREQQAAQSATCNELYAECDKLRAELHEKVPATAETTPTTVNCALWGDLKTPPILGVTTATGFLHPPYLDVPAGSTPEAPATVQTNALRDVIAERVRQVEGCEYTVGHDMQHVTAGELARAAACYAYPLRNPEPSIATPLNWPHGWKWEPRDRRRDLVRAGALLLAEIERFDNFDNLKKEK